MSVKIPRIHIIATMAIYDIFKYKEIPFIESREDTLIISPLFVAKKGRKSNNAMQISSKPNIKLQVCSLFCFWLFSAIVNISLDERSSSTVTEKKRAINFSESMLGYPLPDSHFEIAALET